METIFMDQVKGRLTDLDKRKRETGARKRQAEDALNLHQGYVKRAEERRTRIVEEDLVSDDPATVAWAQNEIDELDAQIISDKRLVEGYSVALAKAVADLDAIRVQWHELDRQVEEQEFAEALAAWKLAIERAFTDASDALDRTRTSLGELCVSANAGAEKFGHPAHALLTQLSEQFFHEQANLDTRGFQDRYDYNREQFSFVIRPMIRKV